VYAFYDSKNDLYCIKLNFHPYYAFRGHFTFLLLVFQSFWDKIHSLYWKWTPVFMTGLLGWSDKTSGFNSKLRGQDALVWDVPERGNVLSDDKMGLDWTGSGQGNIFVVRLFITRTSGQQRVIVGRECNECVWITVQQEWDKSQIHTQRMRPLWHMTSKGALEQLITNML